MVEFTFLMPCLNEADTIETCVRKAREGAEKANVTEYEVLVADNGSTDGSVEIARAEGARVVRVCSRGYGAALRGGIKAARGKFIIMGDADDSYDWSDVAPFVEQLRTGYDLVMGTRLKGEIRPGAMPFLHRYLGNPVLTTIGNLFFRTRMSDFHCGMRAFRKDKIDELRLCTNGMEFASEMVIKAALAKLKRTEVPITLHPDGRRRPPHLRTWIDGWRHLRFMMLYSPRWIFFYPGLLAAAFGAILMTVLLSGPLGVGSILLDVHTLLVGSMVFLAGTQILGMGLTARIFATRLGLLPNKRILQNFLEKFSLLFGLVAGLILLLIGGLVIGGGFVLWARSAFGSLNYQIMLRIIIPGMVMVLLGLQVFFYSFLFSIFTLQNTSDDVQVSDVPFNIEVYE